MRRTVLTMFLALSCCALLVVGADTDVAKLKEEKQLLAAKKKDLQAKQRAIRDKVGKSQAVAAERKAVDDARKALSNLLAKDAALVKARKAVADAEAKLDKVIEAKLAASPELKTAAQSAEARAAKRAEFIYEAGLVDLQLTHPGSPVQLKLDADKELQALREKVRQAERSAPAAAAKPSAKLIEARKALRAAREAVAAALAKANKDRKVIAARQAVNEADTAVRMAQAKDKRAQEQRQADAAAREAREKAYARLREAKPLLAELEKASAALADVGAGLAANEQMLAIYGEAIASSADRELAAARKALADAEAAQEAAVKSSSDVSDLAAKLKAAQATRDAKCDEVLKKEKNASHPKLVKDLADSEATVKKLGSRVARLSAREIQELAAARAAHDRARGGLYDLRRSCWYRKEVEPLWKVADGYYHGLARARRATPTVAAADGEARAAREALADLHVEKGAGVRDAAAAVKERQELQLKQRKLQYQEALARYKLYGPARRGAGSPLSRRVSADAAVVRTRAAAAKIRDDIRANPDATMAAARKNLADAQAKLGAALEARKDYQAAVTKLSEAQAAVRAASGAPRRGRPARLPDTPERQAYAEKRQAKLVELPEARDLLIKQKQTQAELDALDAAGTKDAGGAAALRKKIATGDDKAVVAARQAVAEAKKAVAAAQEADAFKAAQKKIGDAEEALKAKIGSAVAADKDHQAVAKEIADGDARSKEIDKQVRSLSKPKKEPAKKERPKKEPAKKEEPKKEPVKAEPSPAELAKSISKLEADRKKLDDQRKGLIAKQQARRDELAKSKALDAARKAAADAQKAYEDKRTNDPSVVKARKAEADARAKLDKLLEAKFAKSPKRQAIVKEGELLRAKQAEMAFEAGLVRLRLTHPSSPVQLKLAADQELRKLQQKAADIAAGIAAKPSSQVVAADKKLDAARAAAASLRGKMEADAKVAAAWKAVNDARTELRQAESQADSGKAVREAQAAYEAARAKKLQRIAEAKPLLKEIEDANAELAKIGPQSAVLRRVLAIYGESVPSSADKELADARKKAQAAQDALERAMKSTGLADLRAKLQAAQKARDDKILRTLGKQADYAALAKKEKDMASRADKLTGRIDKLSRKEVEELAELRQQLPAVTKQMYNMRQGFWHKPDIEPLWKTADGYYHGLGAKMRDTAAVAAAQAALRAAEAALADVEARQAAASDRGKGVADEIGDLEAKRHALTFAIAVARYKLQGDRGASSPLKGQVDNDAAVVKANQALEDARKAAAAAKPPAAVVAARKKLTDAEGKLADAVKKHAAYGKADAEARKAQSALNDVLRSDPRWKDRDKARAAYEERRQKKLAALAEAKDLLARQKKIQDEADAAAKTLREVGGKLNAVRTEIRASEDADLAAAKKAVADAQQAVRDAQNGEAVVEARKKADEARKAVNDKLAEVLKADKAYQALQQQIGELGGKIGQVDRQLRDLRKKADQAKKAA